MTIHPDLADLQQTYANLMKTAFAPALRDAGLKGSNGRFELPSPIYWAQLGFQKSAYNGVDRLRFTINLSVIDRTRWADEAAAKNWGKRPSPNTGYSRWATFTRIGTVTPDPEDKWWRLSPEIDPLAVRDDVLADLAAYAIPWLQQQAVAPRT